MHAEPLILQVDSQMVTAVIGGSVALLVAIISAILGPILVARYQARRQAETEGRLSAQLEEAKKSLGRQVQQTTFAVTNEHGTHIRDDVDAIKAAVDELVVGKAEQSSQIRALFSQQTNLRSRERKRDNALASVARAIIGIRGDVASLYDQDTGDLEDARDLEEAIAELEHTTPRSRLPRTRGAAIPSLDEETQ